LKYITHILKQFLLFFIFKLMVDLLEKNTSAEYICMQEKSYKQSELKCAQYMAEMLAFDPAMMKLGVTGEIYYTTLDMELDDYDRRTNSFS